MAVSGRSGSVGRLGGQRIDPLIVYGLVAHGGEPAG